MKLVLLVLFVAAVVFSPTVSGAQCQDSTEPDRYQAHCWDFEDGGVGWGKSGVNPTGELYHRLFPGTSDRSLFFYVPKYFSSVCNVSFPLVNSNGIFPGGFVSPPVEIPAFEPRLTFSGSFRGVDATSCYNTFAHPSRCSYWHLDDGVFPFNYPNVSDLSEYAGQTVRVAIGFLTFAQCTRTSGDYGDGGVYLNSVKITGLLEQPTPEPTTALLQFTALLTLLTIRRRHR